MSRDEFSGRPPKSSVDIHRILKSIHKANEPPKPGPYVRGLPELERKLVAVSAARQTQTEPTVQGDSTLCSPAYYRELLLRRGGFAGGFIGLLLGLNLGLAMPIIIGNVWLFALAPIVTSFSGCAVGLSMARFIIHNRRRDLFGPLVSSRR